MKGLLIKESLADTNVLELVSITNEETWQASNTAVYQPALWTAISFAVADDQADAIAGELSQALMQGWYINASTAAHVYVLFPGKVFKYRKGDSLQRTKAKEYGRSLGIPESQLDWSE